MTAMTVEVTEELYLLQKFAVKDFSNAAKSLCWALTGADTPRSSQEREVD
jgi:hypothetical protein